MTYSQCHLQVCSYHCSNATDLQGCICLRLLGLTLLHAGQLSLQSGNHSILVQASLHVAGRAFIVSTFFLELTEIGPMELAGFLFMQAMDLTRGTRHQFSVVSLLH